MTSKINFGILLIVMALFISFTMRQTLVQPPRIDPNHAFNTERAFERLERILGDERPHPVDTDANDAVRQRLVAEIKEIGFTPNVTDDFHCNPRSFALICARVQNVMFWIGTPGPNAIMVASHYDSVPTGPGAGDDGSGVAASLEIAHILKARELARPVLIMITDGEEVGLIGASQFVKNDPMAKWITAVVSMEARGNSGPVALIETSAPNGRDLAVLETDIKKPIASSLAADVYAAMPNATDVTEYLKLGLDAGNFALGGDAEFYHTPQDNLARLNKRSFFHMGATALGSVESLLENSGREDERQWMYIDLFGLFVLKLPQFLALPFIGLGGLLALALFAKSGKGGIVKSLTFPPLALFLGVGFAIGLTMLIGIFRPETHFAAAHPWALRGAQNAAALFGAALIYVILGKSVPKTRMMMTSWIWFAILGLAATLFFPGAAIVFAPSLAIVFVAAILFKSQRWVSQILFGIAALLFTLIGIMTSALGEIMLFLEYAAPFSLFIVLAFILLVPLFLPEDDLPRPSQKYLPVMGLGVTVLFAVTALFVPAYTADAPRGLSILYTQNDDGDAQWSVRGSDPLPESMTQVAEFKTGRLDGYRGNRFIADAPGFETAGIAVTTLRNEVIGRGRFISLEIEARDTDVLDIALSGEDIKLSSITINGVNNLDDPATSVRCTGRSCRSLLLDAELNASVTELSIELDAYRYGLGPEGQSLLAARPDWALPQHRGDVRAIKKTVLIAP